MRELPPKAVHLYRRDTITKKQVKQLQGVESLRKENLQLSALNKLLLYKNFEFFFTKYLGFQLADFHKQISQTWQNNSKVVVIAPRGHGKSVLASAYALWLLFTAKTPITILVISATQDQSSKFLEKIKGSIEDHPFLSKMLKPVNSHESKWAATEIKCSNGSSVICKPLGSGIRGLHVNYCLCDDILKDEIGSAEKTKKLFFEVVLPTTRTKKGKILVTGTPQSYVDLLADLSNKKNFPDWGFLKFQAVKLKDGEWFEPLWKGMFDLDELRIIKSNMGSVAWSKEYMCEPISGGTSLFPWNLLERAIDNDLLPKAEGSKRFTYYLGMDVALSEKDTADWSVIIIGEQSNDEKHLKVVRVERVKGWGTDRLMQRLVELQGKFQFRHALVEQIGVSYDLANQMTSNPLTRTSFEGFVTSRTNKERILSGLEIAMRNEVLKIPKNDTLIEELLSFGIRDHSSGKQTFEALGKHDDTVMALAMMVEATKEKIGKVSASVV